LAGCGLQAQSYVFFSSEGRTAVINDKALRQVILYQGEQSQVFKAMEELGELQAALSRYLHDPLKHPDIAPIIDEIADVQIMIRQLAIIFGATSVEQRIEYKLNRLAGMLEKWKGEDHAT
jgi:NTP pyrophosphatase (non-canonical NTP hydrolase)